MRVKYTDDMRVFMRTFCHTTFVLFSFMKLALIPKNIVLFLNTHYVINNDEFE